MDSTKEEEEPEGHSSLRTDTFTYLSVVYAQLLLSICITYLLAEVITHNVPLFYFEEYFTYLYSISIIYLLYILIFLKHDVPKNVFGISLPRLKCRKQNTKPKKSKITEHFKSHGSVFIRFGVIIFGLGTVTYAVLELGLFLEIEVNSACHDYIHGINSCLQILFTFLQMYFLFTCGRINIHKFKHVARFGFMHLMATNLCVWFKILIRESIHDINEYQHEFELENTTNAVEGGRWFEYKPAVHFHHNVGIHDIFNCTRGTLMDGIVNASSPYLFPLVIEYSLISSTVVYLMWKNVGVNPQYLQDSEPVAREKSKLDFRDTSRGLFGGLLIFLMIIISFILFFLLTNKEDKHYIRLAVYLVDAVQCVVLLMSIMSSIIGLRHAQKLRYHDDPEDELTGLLLGVSAFGWYLYSLFTIISCILTKSADEIYKHHEEDVPVSEVTLVMIGSFINIIQITIQLFFIKDVSNRAVYQSDHQDHKPGRQMVTFLFMANFSFWLLYTFEAAKVEANPVQQHFYGAVPWAILLRITLPMGIFFRFHSTVTLAEIWKNTYKVRLDETDNKPTVSAVATTTSI